MGRNVGRSRGCQICRQRKIKCDEKTPECSQCLRSHRSCPGPLQGVMFLNTTLDRSESLDKYKIPVQRREVSQKRFLESANEKPDSRQDHSKAQPSSSRISWLNADAEARDEPRTISYHKMPSQYRPSRGPAFQELFLDHFIYAFFDPRCEQRQASEWSVALPSFLQSHEQSSSIVYAIRAATMAHYGKISGDFSIQEDSMRWYSKGLQTQQVENNDTQQKLANDGNTSNVLSETTIATPIMFSLFETVMGTTPSAWIHHFNAASHMLQVLGPWRCCEGIMHHMFKVARVGAVYISIISQEESIFATNEWLTIPFLRKKKTPSDWLNDILLKVPECMGLRRRLRDLRLHNSASEQLLANSLESKAQWLLIRFQEYWKEHSIDIDPDYDWEQYHEVTNFANPVEEWSMTPSQPINFQNRFAARIVAEYDAGNILVYSILREVHRYLVDEYKQKVVLHCASILETVRYLDSLGVESGGNTSLVFPLRTAYQCTPSQVQKIQSVKELERWGKTRGVEGAIKMSKDAS